MDNIRLTVAEEDEGMRADKYVSENTAGYSREKFRKIFDSGLVLTNGCAVKPSQKVRTGDVIDVTLPEIIPLKAKAENIPLNIVYEDEDVAVIDKPQGMVVHPAPGSLTGTLTNALLYHFGSLSSVNGTIRPGIVHRIDKDTSGLLVVAKNDFAHNALAVQFQAHSLTRAYKAIVHGVLENARGVINAPIGRSAANRKMMDVTLKNNKHAVTHYTLLNSNTHFSFVRLQLETGRTHQIRVHMKYIGHPVVGDRIYGYNNQTDKLFEGQLLHAYLLGFNHPRNGAYIEFESAIPQNFYKIMDIQG